MAARGIVGCGEVGFWWCCDNLVANAPEVGVDAIVVTPCSEVDGNNRYG